MDFKLSSSINYHLTGKFIAESDHWTHYTRRLDDYELMVVTKGTLYIANNEKKFTVREGEYLLMPPAECQFGFKESRCTFYWLHVGYNPQNSVTEESGSTISLPLQASLPASERIIVLMKQLQDSDRRYHNQKLNSFLAAAIFTEIEQQISSVPVEDKCYSQEHLLEEVKDYIKWHLQENLKVSNIAQYFGYNEKYLTTLFRNTTGTPIKQYILQSKMEQAKITLSDTNMQIAQIAYNLGFEDSHNFSNAFKKITGLSPSEYKQNYGKEKINREK